jgi:predicted metal-dependent peptidase
MSNNIASKAAVRLAMHYPFWAELFYSMKLTEVTPGHPLEKQIQTEATDGKNLWINTTFFGGLSLENQVNELVHELSHKMFIHCSRQGYRDASEWNVACDYAINEMMVKNGFKLGADWLRAPEYEGWLAEAIYADMQKKKKDGEQPKKMPGHRADIQKPEGTLEEQQQMEQEIQATVDRALQNAKARGDTPKGVEQNVMASFRPVGERWYNTLQRYMQDLRASNYNWARLNRRALRTHGVFAPLHYGEAMGDIVIFIDASGSCFEKQQQARFADHLNAILAEAKPARTIVYYFDTKAYPYTEYETGAFDVELRPVGGGGTDFRGLFKQAEEDGFSPDVALVLTDMMGPMPSEEPAFPVIWADVIGIQSAPFGEYIHVE